MIFVLHQLQEKCLDQHKNLHAAFVDLTKAFNNINWELLWALLAEAGCSPWFVKVLHLFHDNMQAAVKYAGEINVETLLWALSRAACCRQPCSTFSWLRQCI